jgi:ubiquinol-cytochrome c reductase cytochrome b subunit
MLPNGEFIEVHQPLGPVDEHGHGRLTYAAFPVPKRMNQLGAGTPFRHIRGFFYPVKEKPEIQAALDELEASEADQHDRQHQLTD